MPGQFAELVNVHIICVLEECMTMHSIQSYVPSDPELKMFAFFQRPLTHCLEAGVQAKHVSSLHRGSCHSVVAVTVDWSREVGPPGWPCTLPR